jgi:hypothetical protein
MAYTWEKFFKDTWFGYQVSHDEHLKKASKDLYWLFEDAGLLTQNFRNNSQGLTPYRRAFVHQGDWKSISSEIPPRIYKYFKENIIDYLEIDDKCFQLKVEELLHVDDTSIDQHNKKVRVNGITPSTPKEIPQDYAFGTAMWHTDASLPLSNMVMMIYVDDVEEGMGEFVVADPVRRLYHTIDKYNGQDMMSIEEFARNENYIPSDEISAKHLTGSAGTVLGFNSHILHRANIPHKHRRRCIHLNILSPFSKHKAPAYHKMQGEKIEKINFETLI